MQIDLEIANRRQRTTSWKRCFGISSRSESEIHPRFSSRASPLSPHRQSSIGRDGSEASPRYRRRVSSKQSDGDSPTAFAEFDEAKRVDIAFRLERDEYRGESRLQANIADIMSEHLTGDANRRRQVAWEAESKRQPVPPFAQLLIESAKRG